MYKKFLATAILVCSLPVMANAAWLFNTQAKTAGGTIDSRNMAGQSSLNNALFKSYTTHATLPATVTANAGYTITKIVRNGVTILNPASPYATTVSGGAGADVNQSLYATFQASKLSVTASVSDPTGGSVTPTSAANIFYGKQWIPIVFKFTPKPGFSVSAISGTAGFTVSPALPAAIGAAVTVTIPKDTVLTGAVNLVGTLVTTAPKAYAPAPKTVAVGAAVTLTGTNLNPVFQKWSSVSRPAGAAAIATANVNPTSFTPAVAGTYVFKYRVADSSSSNTTVTATSSYPDTARNQCYNCHFENNVGVASNTFGNWSSSLHNNSFHPAMCDSCHVGANAGGHPGSNPANACSTCHTGPYGFPDGSTTFNVAACASCHAPGKDIHAASHTTETSCIACHDVAIKHPGNVVSDNNGVRSITQEFTKWSHHVTGVDLNDAHCAACHLAGKVVANAVVVDTTKHMADAIIHLRNADTDADMQWDPAAPNHSTMDNYCMSCHDANGATSAASVAIQAFINSNGLAAAGKTASSSNPFGDTISNRYDKMLRPAVVNVDDQFDTTNNSHHGVKGPRYTGRTLAAGARQIASPATFAANSSSTLWGKRSTIYDSVNATTGVKEVLNPAFTTLYTPLEDAGGELAPRTGAATLGDDSTLHCGDCHTVGQWKANAAKNADGTNAAAAIGAHGSNNEYMLRNDKGIDERHTQEAYTVSGGVVTYSTPNAARLICYNCHAFKRYGSVYNATGAAGPHAGEYDSSGRCNGVGNTIPFNGYTTGSATDGIQFESRIGEFTRAEASSTPAFAPGFPLNFANAPGGVQAATYTGEQNADFGNIFGIQCLNCHNSGIGNGYGGIHGSANNSPGTANTIAKGGYGVPDPSVTGGAYVDGMGNTTKVQRFLPGLGNIMHVPGTLGGFITAGTTATSWRGDVGPAGSTYTFTTGAIASDTNWEQVGWRQAAGTPTAGPQVGAGCYTLNDEGTATPGVGLDDPNSASYGIKGQPWDGTTTQTPNAAKTWGGCDDHTGTSVGSSDHGFVKRINRPVTY